MRQCLVLGFSAHPGSGCVGSAANNSAEKALASFHSLLLCNLFPLPLLSQKLGEVSFIHCQPKASLLVHVLMFSTEIPCDSPSSGQSSLSQYFPSVVHKHLPQSHPDLRSWKFWKGNLGTCILMSFLCEFMHDKAWVLVSCFFVLFCLVFSGERNWFNQLKGGKLADYLVKVIHTELWRTNKLPF